MATATTRITAEEFHAVRDRYPRWTELIDGEIVVNEPKPRHARPQVELLRVIGNWTHESRGRGAVWSPIDVEIGEYDVYAPDVSWVADPARVDDEEGLQGLPDLCVEIRSPSTWRYDLRVKLPMYEARGVPEAWLVDTLSESVIVFRRSRPDSPRFDVSLELRRGETLTSPQMPGFAVAIDLLFTPVG